MTRFFLAVLFSILLVSCARVGSPIGGDKDTIAPVFLGANIDSPRTNVPRDLHELRLYFDEYITLKEVQKNLTVSPPLKRITRILPGNLATKYVSIVWEDTLQTNTTYNFNFGNAIQDNNENNPLRYFNYAFSTGDKIDDLYISGEVRNLMGSKKTTEPRSTVVGLYKIKDSLTFRDKPYYVAKVDDDGYYELNYLAPGTYRILAFEDENANSLYDAGTEKVGFLKDAVVLDKSVSGLNINLSASRKAVRYREAKAVPGGVLLLFEGNPEKVEITSLSEKLKDYKVTHRPKSDSVRIWFDAMAQNIGTDAPETLRFRYNVPTEREATVSYRYNSKDVMEITNTMGSALPPLHDFRITSNYLISRIDTQQWTLKSDSLTTEPFTAKISETNPYEILVSSAFKEGKNYQLTVPKGTVSSYYATTQVSKRFDFQADAIQNYGSFTIRLANAPESKFWVQLTEGDKVVYSSYTAAANTKFPIVKPGSYTLRILVDNNNNGYWDGADLATETFAEEGYVYGNTINIRPLWESVEDWDLQNPENSLKKSAVPASVPDANQPGNAPTAMPNKIPVRRIKPLGR